MHNGFFVTGTDTDIGKTLVSLGLVERLKQRNNKVAIMKPVATGCQHTEQGLRNDDAELLHKHASMQFGYDVINPYAFAPAIAPHIAANEQGIRIDIEKIYAHFVGIAQYNEYVVVEGAGGWQAPLNDFQTMADLAKRLKLPIILTVGIRLGCINHALLTAESIQQQGLHLAGWVANQIEPEMPYAEENIQAIEERLSAPRLGTIPYLESLRSHALDPKVIANKLTLPEEKNSRRPAWVI